MTGHFNLQLRKSIPSILSKKHNRFTFLNLVIMRQTDRHVDRLTDSEDMISSNSLALVFSSRSIKVSPRFLLGRENVPCVAEVVNRSLKAYCTDVTSRNGAGRNSVNLGGFFFNLALTRKSRKFFVSL